MSVETSMLPPAKATVGRSAAQREQAPRCTSSGRCRDWRKVKTGGVARGQLRTVEALWARL